VFLSQIKEITFIEAKARCQAMGKQLPEIYDEHSMQTLSLLMRNKKVSTVWAGIQFDPNTAIQRFISTGMPIYRGFSKLQVYHQGKSTSMRLLFDDSHASFLYAHNNSLCVTIDESAPGAAIGNTSSGAYGARNFREKALIFTQITSSVICENKWNGKGFEMVDPNFDQANIILRDFIIDTKRADPNSPFRLYTTVVTPNNENQKENKINYDTKEMANTYKMTCYSIVDHANDTYKGLKDKTDNLLALVDISYHLEQMNNDQKRKKRAFSFLSKVIFKTGFKAIWGLFGFAQQIRQDIKIHNLEKQIVKSQRNTAANAELIKQLSATLQNQSIAVEQLQLLTANLERRIEALERDMKILQDRVSSTEARLEIAVKLQLISHLIVRTEQALKDGYNVLEDIIHHSLLGQTSPKVLPLSQVEVVQSRVQKVSSADLDTDFSKMQSIVVSDPNDPRLLLIIVNAAAISKSTTELVSLIAIPVFGGSKTVKPVLSYQTIILNQWIGTYVVLTEQEEANCLLHRCYVHGMEKSIYDNTCGIPQYSDKNLDACTYEEVEDDSKTHLISALPDGAFFSFKETVDAQLFCADNNLPGRLQKVSGMGVLQLPNGCTLSITDKKGRNSKLKGPPLHNFIQGHDVVIIDKLPMSVLVESTGLANRSQTAMDQMLQQHLGQIQEDLVVTNVKLQAQETTVITTVCISIAIVIILIVAIIIAIKFSGKIKERLKFVWGVVDNIRRRLGEQFNKIPFSGALRHLMPIPLKMMIKSEKQQKKTEKFLNKEIPSVGKKPRLRAFRYLIKKNRKGREEPHMRWSELHRNTLRETTVPQASSHAYVSLERFRIPQPQPRTLYPQVDQLMGDLKTVSQEVENREKEAQKYDYNSMRRLDRDLTSVRAEGSVISDIDQYDVEKNN
jgi:hypothetical protein